MLSFVLCDTYLVIWKGLIIVTVIQVIAVIEGMCIFLLTELILNVQKYSDKWLWSKLKMTHSYCFSITY